MKEEIKKHILLLAIGSDHADYIDAICKEERVFGLIYGFADLGQVTGWLARGGGVVRAGSVLID